MIKHLREATNSQQLKEGCKFSHAIWAAWLEPVGGNWEIQSQARMTRIRREWLKSLIEEKSVIVWLAGAVSSGRRRFREIGRQAHLAGCKRLFIFPGAGKRQLLLVGTDLMDQNSEAFWRVIALNPPEYFDPPIHPQGEGSPSNPIQETPDRQVHPLPGFEDASRQLLAFKENSRELTELAQAISIVSAEAATHGLEAQIQEVLQRFVHRLRQLVGARYAQLGWIKKEPPAEPIPQALGKEHPIRYHTILTDSDSGESGSILPQSDVLFSLHTYIATVRESVQIHDFQTWSGLTAEPQPQTSDARINPIIDLEGDGFRYRAALGIPLQSQKEISGTIVVFDDRADKTFTQQDLELLELFAHQIEIAIGYAQLNALLQERITAQNLAESRLIRSSRLAAVGEMAAGVAHELNNPLTTVTGFVELVLNETPLDSPFHDDLELALKEALRARGIVRGLLDFSRPSQDQRIPTDLNDLISQVLNLIRHMLRMNDLSMRLELWDDLPLVTVDPNKIQQVLHNLMHNAIRAMPCGGTMTVRTAMSQKPNPDVASENHRWATIQVQDTGVGIPDKDLGRIFVPFFTHNSTNQVDDPGIGLGLAVSYGIIQSHGGSIEVESTIDQGSSFTVYLPLGEA